MLFYDLLDCTLALLEACLETLEWKDSMKMALLSRSCVLAQPPIMIGINRSDIGAVLIAGKT